MANVPKAITDLPVASAMGDDDLLVVSQNATTSSIKGELIKGYAQNAVAPQVTAAQTAATQASQSATQAEAARQGAAAAQTAAENAQDAAETARDQSVAAAGTIGDSTEQAQTAAGQASSAKDAAVAAQSAAEAAKTAAETASGQAQTAATQASGSATAAQTAATQAGDAKTGAETARNEAETSASSAANSASDAESAATEAEQAKTYIENMDMEGETLPAGSSVTVTKTTSPEGDLLFVIGVPQGIQGDKGETGETGATGPQGVSVTNATVNEDGDLVITLSAGDPINAGSVIGPQGEQGEVGPTGVSVDRIERTSGTGAPGTTDTYTVYLTDGQTGGTFQVYNGSGGFMSDGSVPMTGDLNVGGHRVTNVSAPTQPTDAVRQSDLEAVSQEVDHILDGTTPAYIPPATAAKLGGVIVGDGIEVEADGTISTSPVPAGGTEGQMLYKSADGAAWGDKPVMIVNVTNAEDASLTTDKTLDEIKEAYLNDVNIFTKYMDALFPLAFAEKVEGENPSFKFFNYSTSIGSGGPHLLVEAEIKIFRIQGEDFAYFYLRNGGLVPTDGNQGEMLYCNNTGRSHWGPAPKGIPDGGTTGQVLTKTSTGEEWSDAPSGLPSGGTEGQMLYQGGNGPEWGDKPVMYVNITESGGTYSADKTFAEIESAIESEYSVVANVKERNGEFEIGFILPLAHFVSGSVVLFALYLNGSFYSASVASNNFASYSEVKIPAMSISFTPISTLTSQNVQDAIAEVYTKTAHTYQTITLSSSAWSSNSQTVAVSGVTADELDQLITPTPAIASQSAYYEAGIMCTGQAANSLTFTCQTVPTSNLTVYVVIQLLN